MLCLRRPHDICAATSNIQCLLQCNFKYPLALAMQLQIQTYATIKHEQTMYLYIRALELTAHALGTGVVAWA